MLIEFEFDHDVCLMRLRGKFITGGDARFLRSKVEELKATGYRKVLADFREVPYLDSTGIGFVVSAYTTLRNSGGRFVLANINPHVAKSLEITKLLGVIPNFPSEESALSALAETAESGAGAS